MFHILLHSTQHFGLFISYYCNEGGPVTQIKMNCITSSCLWQNLHPPPRHGGISAPEQNSFICQSFLKFLHLPILFKILHLFKFEFSWTQKWAVQNEPKARTRIHETFTNYEQKYELSAKNEQKKTDIKSQLNTFPCQNLKNLSFT